MRDDGRRCEGKENRAKECYTLDFAAVRVRACEDRLEDTGEVERVERRRERRGDDGTGFRKVIFRC